MSRAARRIWLGVATVVVGSLAGLWAAATLPNPPGNGPGVGQVLAGVLVPVSVVSLTAVAVRVRIAKTALAAGLSLAVTGGLLALFMWAFATLTHGVD